MSNEVLGFVFFFKQKTAYEMVMSDWSSDVCSSDLPRLSVMAVAGPNPTEVTKGTSFTIMPAGGVGTIVCSWAFGDITTGSGCSTTHTYAARTSRYIRSEEHTSELQSLITISYAV